MAERVMVSPRKWDVWFRKLPPSYKTMFDYLYTHPCGCTRAGFWDRDDDTARHWVNDTTLSMEDFLMAANDGQDRIKTLKGGKKWFVIDYIWTQNTGGLKRFDSNGRENRVHAGIYAELERYGIDPLFYETSGFRGSTEGLQTLLDKDKDKDKETKGGVGGFKKIPPDIVDLKAEFVKRGYAPSNATDFYDHHNAAGWILKNGKLMRDWGSAIGTWIRMGKKFGTLEKLPPLKQASTSAPIVEGPQISDEDRRKLIEGALPGYSRKRLIQKT